MLLCPYGPITVSPEYLASRAKSTNVLHSQHIRVLIFFATKNLVNHNQTRANVKLQWSDPKRSNHVPDLLDQTINEFAKDRTAKLAMDLIATRPILEGEEVLLDYGDAWEKAWQLHVQNWNIEGGEDYVSAYMLNQENATNFRTEYQQLEEPYPGNVNIECDSNIWKRINQTLFETTHTIVELDELDHDTWWICDILRHREVNGTTLYTVVVTRPQDEKKKKKDGDKEKEKHLKLTDIPAMAIRFTDRPYTSDMFLEQAFRHSIMIPNELFPDQWMNFSPA